MESAHGLVLLGVIFLYFQLILGRSCRWSTNWLVRKGADAAYNLSNLFGSVALGAMPKEHSTAVWILYLTVLNNSMATYDGKSELQFVFTCFNIVCFLGRALLIVSRAGLGGAASYLAYAFVVAMVCASAYCKISTNMASTSKRSSEEIAQYMRREHVADPRRREHKYYNASSLKGYRYVVNSETRTTVEDVFMQSYSADDVEASRREGELARRKDLCLSFALFRLLFRRYHGLPCAEAKLPKTRDLVLEGLLPAGDEPQYTRGFGVIAVELGFLHDHIHGGYVLWSRSLRIWYCVFSVLKVILLYIISPTLYFYAVTTHGGQPVHDPFIIILLLLLHGSFDLLQLLFYYTSDRWMVSYMCRAHTGRSRQNGFRRMIARMHKLVFWNLYWQNRVGQYSLLDEATAPSSNAFLMVLSVTLFPHKTWFGHSVRESAPEKLPPRLKASIARVLRASRGNLDGVPSLERAHRLPYWEARCDQATHKIKVILKWHIATCYCEMAGQPPAESSVAAVLSKYCAYLVAFRPELLPGIQSHTKVTFREVLDEVTRLVGDQLSARGRFSMLELRRQQGHLETMDQTVTLSDGLDLGHLLITNFEDRDQLWNILENIWVKLILSIAPQLSQDATYAKHHAKYLAHGGEFVTHLWAMLSHAGILEQTSWPHHQVHEESQEFLSQLIDSYA
ncbi:hypothetical protein ACP70R_019917 [Stipagrostis hirtigluma subsp. patula]